LEFTSFHFEVAAPVTMIRQEPQLDTTGPVGDQRTAYLALVALLRAKRASMKAPMLLQG